jgi:hypothetical protein
MSNSDEQILSDKVVENNARSSCLDLSMYSSMIQDKRILFVPLGILFVLVLVVLYLVYSNGRSGVSLNGSNQDVVEKSSNQNVADTVDLSSSVDKSYFVLPQYYFRYMPKVSYSNVPLVPNLFNVRFDDQSLKLEYFLGGELVMDRPYDLFEYINDSGACPLRLPARPMVSRDGTRLYFVDKDEPNKVKMMDTNKEISVIYTTPEPQNFIAYIAVDKNNNLAYTILEKNPLDCKAGNEGPWVEVTGYHLINGKMYKIYDGQKFMSFEGVIDFGDNYFITVSDANGLGTANVHHRMYKIKDVYMELIQTFGSMIYKGKNYIIVYGKSSSLFPEVHESVLKVSLDDGSIETIFSKDTVGKEVFIFGLETVVHSDGRIELKYTDNPSDLDDYADYLKREEILKRASTFVYEADR